MTIDPPKLPARNGTRRRYLLTALLWSSLLGGSLFWNLSELASNTLQTATSMLRASLSKDIAFRNWVGKHGGVYVPPRADTPSNPYLDVPERDIETTTGKHLTLINPAYSIRLLQQDFGNEMGIISRLTSLKLFNPANAPDNWERQALLSFEQGAREALAVGEISGQPYLRLMLPLPVTQECLKCHNKQDYQIGDNRGGLGASLPLTPLLLAEEKRRSDLTVSHGLIWLAGLAGMLIVYRRQLQYARQQRKTHQELLKLSQAVEQSPISTVITNLQGDIEYVNAAFVDNTGYSRSDSIGKNPSMLNAGKTPSATFNDMWLRISQGQTWEGELINRRKNGSEYIEWGKISPIRDTDGQITHYLAVKEDITRRKRAEQEISHLAFFDQLTDLPNRRLMMDRLAQAMSSCARFKRQGALLLIDLDDFKTLNDTQGHATGDDLLREVSTRLQASLREGDTVARLGGDEFVVILKDLGEGTQAAIQAESVAGKLCAWLRQPYLLTDPASGGQRPYHCTASIGITLFDGQSLPADELLKRADTAMYRAKAAGRDSLRFFDPEMQTSVAARAAMEIALRKAITEEQFLLHFQPQVDAAGRMTGAEVLIRWQHPERGMVPPGEFIPLAEESGLILPIGHWVLHTACQQLAAWAARPQTAHLNLAVNVSARQFSLPNLVEQVLALIEQTGAPPERLKLELTESMLLDNTSDMIAKMHALKARGVSFSLDDFGTGYSSLSYLKRLPLDQLKIDQSFVRDVLDDPNDAAIARTIVTLGQSLGLAVIAEGVETAAQRDFLAASGCLNYQGYFFSRPVPLAAFEQLLTDGDFSPA
jgi:diguanylate cyclase (GGDEF)-like protein/PAS domain S-box-containing protein